MRTLCDACHEERESHYCSILDIIICPQKGLEIPWGGRVSKAKNVKEEYEA